MACSGGDIQAASGGALSAENIKLKIGSRFYDREPYSGAWDEPFNVACEVLNAALAAHDQKVRREAFEEIALYLEVNHRDDDDAEWKACCNLPDAIRSLASPAPAASKPEAGKGEMED